MEEKSVRGAEPMGEDRDTSYSPPTISLPKGGGAIKGIGEKFGVNPVNGTATMTVPVFTSPSRSDFYPKLSLSYDSGAGNGPFGFGWHLSIPSITRKTDKGLPLYQDAEASDVFLLSDAEDLMPCLSLQSGQWLPLPVPDATWAGETYSVERFRPRIEGVFSRIEKWQKKSDGEVHWRGITNENVTSIYGMDPNCRIADPMDTTHIFKWLLESTFDDRGNVIFYEYKPEDQTGIVYQSANEYNRQNGNAPYVNLYIKRIHYGPQSPYVLGEDLSRRSDWLFEVVFDYGEHNLNDPTSAEDPTLKWATRADPFSSFRSTFDIRNYRLCQRVLMFHHFNGPNPGQAGYDGVVRSTVFGYDQEDSSSPFLGNSIATKLVSITQTGYALSAGNPPAAKNFPPLEFIYSEAEIDPTVRTVDADALQNLPVGADGSSYKWLDLDGEGLSGIITEQAGEMFYKRNDSPITTTVDNGVIRTRARFQPLERVASGPKAAGSRNKLQFMDLSSDGRQDLVNLDGPQRGYYERTSRSGWVGFNAFESFPNLDTNDPNARFIDVNGDGLTDLLISEDEVMSWYRSLGHEGFGARQFVTKPFDEQKGPALVFSDATQSIFLADMTGDGLSDIVRIRSGEVCYWPNRGYGRFGAKVTMDNSPTFDAPNIFEQSRIHVADIDGCGNSDIIYLAARGVAVYHNQAGNSWSDEVLLSDVPPIESIDSVDTVDLLGNGTACLVWSSPLPSKAGHQMEYIDLMGSEKPHLLISVKNNLGVETRVRYASSTKFYVQDRDAGTPWITKLPFPVYVVERAESFDYIGRTRLVTTYRYRHGCFDGVEREFRGFGYVEQGDAETFGDSASIFTEDTDNEADALHIPPSVTKTWFHTGAWPNESSIIHHMAHEYFSSADDGTLLPDTILPTDVFIPDPAHPEGTRIPYFFSGEERREAVRALKGSILHQEIYSDDGTPQAGIPYSVSERNYTVECLQPKGENLYGVFFAHPRETINYYHERKPADPRVTHSAVLDVNPFGNILQNVSVAYGRNLNSAGAQLAPSGPPDLTVNSSTFVQPEQTIPLLTLTENRYTRYIDEPDAYRTPMPSEICAYELTRPSRADESVIYSFSDLQGLASAAVEILYEDAPNAHLTQKRLFEDVRTLYLKDDLSGPMPPDRMDSLGLAYESYKLSMTAGLAQRIFVTNNTNPNKPDANSLNAFISSVGAASASGAYANNGGGYVNSNGDTDWWIPSGQTIYSTVPPNPSSPFVQDPAFAAANFYLPQAHCDAFGQYTRLRYDTYNTLLVQTDDAIGNTVTAQNDYRVLKPFLITDPNGNCSEVRFDILGLVIGTAVEGKIGANGSTESGDSFSDFTVDLQQSDIDGFIAAADPASLAPGLLGTATTRIIYDLDCFRVSQMANPTDPTQWAPPFAATIERETHTADLQVGQQSKVRVSFGYFDGFGREIQRKVQAESGPLDLTLHNAPVANPRWIGSGWIILNNKGKPVREYEPFFTATHDFEFANKVGVTPTLFYDPLNRVVARLYPNHTWEKTIFDAWQEITWDANDTVMIDPTTDPDVGDMFRSLPASDCLPTWYQLRTGPTASSIWTDPDVLREEQDAAAKAAAHNDTPTSGVLDVLGRRILSVSHNRYQKNGATVDEFYSTRTSLDIEGNQLSVTDALGRTVMLYDHDMLKNVIHQSSMDAGERWILKNVYGKPIFTWDSRGFARAMSYDELQRPVALNVNGNGLTNIMAEKIVYGDSKTEGPSAPEQTNQRGRVYTVYDAAGTITNLGLNPSSNQDEGYDFKGNLLRSSRALLVGNSYRSSVDWNQNPQTGEVFTASTRFDALNRIIQQVAPHSNRQGITLDVTQPAYDESCLLQSVDVWVQQPTEPSGLLDPASASLHAVTNIDYDAKGLRTMIEYGILDARQNSIVNTTYQYDPETFRLTNLATTRSSDGTIFQGFKYCYDPTGNITHIMDDAQDTIYFRNKKVEPSSDYIYDAIYRLVSATGREHLAQSAGIPNIPTSYNDWPNINLVQPTDGNAMGTYVEDYEYDPVGNIEKSQHTGSDPASPGWTRTYAYDEISLLEPGNVNNRLTNMAVGGTTETYSVSGNGYDPHGNMLHMPQLQSIQWDFKDEMQLTQRQAVNAADTDGTQHGGEQTYYVYDSSGQRVRKVTESSAGTLVKERIYLGGFEIYREYTGVYAGLERQTLHVMDDKQRVAIIESRNSVDDGTPAQLIRFQFGNHLGSSSLELDDNAQVISYEEYYPYGCTSYQGANTGPEAKRYRYTGKERDEESGLYYHGARYYAPWLGRWTSCDPIGLSTSINLYTYVLCSPTTWVDPSGFQEEQGPSQDNGYRSEVLDSSIRIQKDQSKPPPYKNPNVNFKAGARDTSIGAGAYESAIHINKYMAVEKNLDPSYPPVVTPHADIEMELRDPKTHKEIPMTIRYVRYWAMSGGNTSSLEGWKLLKNNTGFVWDAPSPDDAPGFKNVRSSLKTGKPFGQLQEFLAGNPQSGGAYYQVYTLDGSDGTNRVIVSKPVPLSPERFSEFVKAIRSGTLNLSDNESMAKLGGPNGIGISDDSGVQSYRKLVQKSEKQERQLRQDNSPGLEIRINPDGGTTTFRHGIREQ